MLYANLGGGTELGRLFATSPDFQAAEVIFLPTLVFTLLKISQSLARVKIALMSCNFLKLDSTTRIITGARICAGLHSFASTDDIPGWRKQKLHSSK